MSDFISSAYCYGKTVARISHPFKAHDNVFGAAQCDREEIQLGDFERCTFANVSFKEAILRNTRFRHCVFIGCYFRRADLTDCEFVGCRFVDCNFNHVAVKSCDFRYASFSGCQLPYDELRHCLPSEPNLREELSRNLSLESSRLGLASETRRYRMAEIRAREENLWAAFLSQSRWYQEHYDSVARAAALGGFALSLLNRRLWGYGQSSWVLLRNVAVLGFAVFPGIFYLLRGGLQKIPDEQISLPDLFYFSFENMLPTGFHSGIQALSFGTRLTAGIEALTGVVAFALFASYIYRWSLHR